MTSAQQESGDFKPKANQKSIGSKVVDSHPCHGYETKQSDSVQQFWIGDDIDNLVHSEVTSKVGKSVISLKSYSKTAPKTDLLAIPSGYKEMKMPGK